MGVLPHSPLPLQRLAKKGGKLYFSPLTKKLQGCTLTVYPTQVDFLGDYISVLRGAAHQIPHFAMRYNP